MCGQIEYTKQEKLFFDLLAVASLRSPIMPNWFGLLLVAIIFLRGEAQQKRKLSRQCCFII